MRLLITVLVLLLLPKNSLCMLDSIKHWLFGSYNQRDVDKSLTKNGIKFEVVSTDEKFLKFASALSEMSPLDACYHIVVYSLKRKCGELTEEELGKLAVQLLNCQSEAENRQTFVCTQDMTIAECTKSMDGPTWNAYQIVGNRARAMCYATQQDQFRRMTEMAVNDLATAAEGQLESMQQLMKGQEMLHSITTETVQKLFESQQELLGTHQQLRIAHQDIMSHVEDNMGSLVKEKSLIATGNKQLADMVENIKKKLDMTAEKMTTQEKNQQENYKNIIQDLNNIQRKAQDALYKLDESSKQLLQNHKEMTKFYLEMYQNVVKINGSVSQLMTTVQAMQRDLEQKISWFSHMLGSSEDKLEVLMLCGQHLLYFVFAIVLAIFLQVPRFSRLAIIVAVLVNAGAELKFGQKFGFKNVTGFILTIVTANVMYHIWRPKLVRRDDSYLALGEPDLPDSTTSTNPLSQTDIQTLKCLLERLQKTLSDLVARNETRPAPIYEANNAAKPDSSTPEDVDHVRRYLAENFNDSIHCRHGTPQPSTSSAYPRSFSRSSTPSRSSTISVRCQGVTRSGTPCRLTASAGNFCHVHRDT